MQRNVSPLTTIIVVLLAVAIAAFVWIRLSTGPKPTTQQERSRRQQGAGARRRGDTTTEQRSTRVGTRRGSRRGGGQGGGGRRGQRSGAGGEERPQPEAPGATTETPAAEEPESEVAE